jgi:hypothetical protein
MIATAVDLRAANLKTALAALIDDDVLRNNLYKHWAIAGINNAVSQAPKSATSRAVGLVYNYRVFATIGGLVGKTGTSRMAGTIASANPLGRRSGSTFSTSSSKSAERARSRREPSLLDAGAAKPRRRQGAGICRPAEPRDR